MDRFIMFSLNEYKKLILQTKTKILIVLFVLGAVGTGLVFLMVENSTGVQMVAPQRFPVYVLELVTGIVLPVLAIFIGSELFSAEFKDGTMKNLFALPVSKSIIYLGKMLAGVAVTATCLLALGVSGLVFSIAVNGTEALGDAGGFIISYLGAAAFLVPVLVVTGFFALLAGSPGMAIIINLLIWFVTGIAGSFIPGLQKFLPTGFEGWYHPLVNGVNMAAALPPLLYMVSYCILFGVAGMILFERKEV